MTVKDLISNGGLILILSLIPPIIAVFIFYDTATLRFCWSKQCLDFFVDHFEIPIRVFYFSFYAIAVIAAVLQLRVSRIATRNQAASSHASNCLSHLNEFKSFLQAEVSLIPELDVGAVSAAKVHRTLFPKLSLFTAPADPDEASDRLKDESGGFYISELAKLVEASHQQYATEANEFPHEKHQQEARRLLHAIGVTIDELPRDDYYALESVSAKLLNQLTQLFCPTLPRIIEHPSYRA